MAVDFYRCSECRDHLFNEIDIDTGICGYCADRMYENSRARDDWNSCHDEPMPSCEVPNPRPFRKAGV